MTEAACDKQKAKAQDTENVMPDAAQADAKTACGCGKEAASSEEKKDTAVAELTEKLQQAEKKIAENYDMYVRAMAEVENTRKRAEADVLKAEKFGIDKFATNLLPVMDSLEKAMEHAQKEEGPMKDGLLAIYRQLVHAMEVSGMKSFEPVGEKFDPNRHQAVTVVPPAEGQESGTVATVFQKGWMIQERVLRPVMVAVAQG